MVLKDLESLKHLDISHNKLTQVSDNLFASLKAIESINFSHNELKSIQQFTFSDLKTLQTLDLASNQLHTDDFLEQAATIKSIDLQNNQYLEMNLSAFKTVGSVILNNNPWNCSWLVKALSKREHLVSNLQFGFEFDNFTNENLTKPLTQEVECHDYRQPTEVIRKIIIINSDCDAPKNEKKVRFLFIFCRFFFVYLQNFKTILFLLKYFTIFLRC